MKEIWETLKICEFAMAVYFSERKPKTEVRVLPLPSYRADVVPVVECFVLKKQIKSSPKPLESMPNWLSGKFKLNPNHECIPPFSPSLPPCLSLSSLSLVYIYMKNFFQKQVNKY